MAAMFQPWSLFLLFFLFFHALPLCFSQSNSPQNIETFFPQATPPPTSPPSNPQTPPTGVSSLQPSSSSSSNGKVGKAIAITAATTLVIAAVFFFCLHRFFIAPRSRRISHETNTISHPNLTNPPEESQSFDGTLKGLIVDENGLDVMYWRKLEGGQLKTSFRKDVFSKPFAQEHRFSRGSRKERISKSEPIQGIPLLRGKSSSSLDQEFHDPYPMAPSTPRRTNEIISRQSSISEIPPKQVMLVPPPPPPPPPPIIPVKKVSAPPPPPPPKKNSAPPPPPLKIGGLSSSARPPTIPRMKSSASASKHGESSSSETFNNVAATKAKLKPLHWDKVTANPDHSMVWDKISDGSFRFDDDLMEALFGYVATNRKSPERNKRSNLGNVSSPAQIFILDPRKSQNTAIVLRSLMISRQEILDALLDGQGLNADILEKLSRITPTKEEENQILAFDGNLTKLADAESFLYHILTAVPSPFARVNAMLFRSNYDPEILHLKESLQTLELGCKELRTRGLFLKLLEAILKAGNRMNAGTSRGNAHAFNLSALRKLSDVKSTDGKTTLLHFVVEEVVRAEGKRCMINRNYSLGRSNSKSAKNSGNSSDNPPTVKEDREKEYMMLGLPMVGGLSVELSNVKKAAAIDYDTLANTCSTLKLRVDEIRQLLTTINVSKGSGFVKEMKGIIESAEEELKVVKEEQTRVMELVKKTMEYYQAGASKERNAQPLQLFVIIKDFLGMVDQVCVDITRSVQKKKPVKPSSGSSSPPSPATRRSVKFPQLPPHFMSDKSRTSSSSDLDEEL